MAQYSPYSYSTDGARKIEQDAMRDWTRNRSALWRLLSGAPDLSKMPGASTSFAEVNIGQQRLIEMKFKLGYGASLGVPVGSDLSSFGDWDPSVANYLRISPALIYGRTTIQHEQLMESEGTDEQVYLNWKMDKINGMAKIAAHGLSSVHYGTGQYGKLATVATGGGVLVNSATTEFSVTVDNVSAIPINQWVTFRQSAGTAISNSIVGVAVDKGTAKYGPGTVKFRFPSYVSTSWTIPDAAIICIVNGVQSTSTNYIYANGLDQMIGNTAFPRTEADNVAIDNISYRSTVKAFTGKVTWLNLQAMYREIALSCDSHDLYQESPNDRLFDSFGDPLPGNFFVLCHPNVVYQLKDDLYTSKMTVMTDGGVNSGFKTDLGFRYTEFGGMNFVCDDLCPTNRVWIIHTDAIGRRIIKDWAPLPGLTQDFQHIPQTTQYEMIRSLYFVTLPIHRDCLGKITGDALANSPTDIFASA